MSSAPQQPWLAEGEVKREAVRGLFASIAPRYDLLNSLLSFNQHGRWRKEAVRWAAPQPGESALDVCCGTGDFLLPLREAVGAKGSLAGLDFCQPMLDIAAQKPGHDARLVLGDACDLPWQDESFDVVTVGWGLRNVPDLDKALSEARRVLRPGGRFVSLDMVRPSTFLGRMGEQAFHLISPLLGRIFGQKQAYEYLPKSTTRFLSRSELRARLEAAGFTEARDRDFMFGNIALHKGVKP